jgi:hypothetical protein
MTRWVFSGYSKEIRFTCEWIDCDIGPHLGSGSRAGVFTKKNPVKTPWNCYERKLMLPQ